MSLHGAISFNNSSQWKSNETTAINNNHLSLLTKVKGISNFKFHSGRILYLPYYMMLPQFWKKLSSWLISLFSAKWWRWNAIYHNYAIILNLQWIENVDPEYRDFKRYENYYAVSNAEELKELLYNTRNIDTTNIVQNAKKLLHRHISSSSKRMEQRSSILGVWDLTTLDFL